MTSNGFALEKLKYLHQISEQLNKKAESENLLQTIVATAAYLTESEICAILVLDPTTSMLAYCATTLPISKNLANVRVPLEQSVAGWVFANSRPLFLETGEEERISASSRAHWYDIEPRNTLAIPLFFNGETIGVFEINNKKTGNGFSVQDREILETLATYAAMAIKTSHLMTEEQRVSIDLQELERLKSEFIAIASHELRTPLGLVLGHATYLREIVEEDDYIRQLDVIIRNAEKLKQVIEEMSNIDNLRTGAAQLRMEKVDLHALIDEAIVVGADNALEKQIRLTASTCDRPVLVNGEASRLAVALSNIVKNALTFTPVGGSVHIDLEKLSGHAKLSVSDDGIGIPAQELRRIFDRFYQVENHLTRRHGGMGLGLSIAKAMVEAHGGHIWVESVVGQGSTFSILLPLANP